MDAGDTFLRADNDKHLWVVLSDPRIDPENVLLVNFTSYDQRKERVCLLGRTDHEWIRKETCVNYADAVVTSAGLLDDAKMGGAIHLQKPLSQEVLQRPRRRQFLRP
jgi:hypothetical protein